MNYIVCKKRAPFEAIGQYNYCLLEEMVLSDVIAVDTECTGLIARKEDMFCIQIGTGENNYLIKMYDGEYSFKDVIPLLKERTLVLHNALFDIGFFYKYSFIPKDVKDTYLASKILYNGDEDVLHHDFKAVMERELSVFYDKTEQKNIHVVKLSQPTTIQYCFNDVDRLLELHSVLEKKIIDGGYEETYKLHCSYIKTLAYIERCGLPISSSLWKKKMEMDVENTLLWKKNIEEYIYDQLPEFRNNQLDLFDDNKRILVNISSPLQMIQVFKKFGIPVEDKDGEESINENIISKSSHPFVKMWLSFQEANHRVTTFGDKIYRQIENERIYTNFNPMVDTARLSTRKGYINFLNFPADSDTRNCFVANKGNVMVVCDYSAQETIVAADLSGDEVMTESVISDKDLHCAFARILFPELSSLSDEEIKEKHKKKRQEAKSPRFAFQYGGNAYTIHMNTGIPLAEANKIEKAFKQLHAGLYQWGRQVFDEAVSCGYIESADGWKLKLPSYKKFLLLQEKIEEITKEQWSIYRTGKEQYKAHLEDKKYVITNKKAVEFYKEKRKTVSDFFKLKSEYERLCLNNPVQTTSAHQLKKALYSFFQWIVENNYFDVVLIANAVHDEAVIECPSFLSKEVKTALEQCMVEAGNYYLTNLTIKADASIGPSWGEAKH